MLRNITLTLLLTILVLKLHAQEKEAPIYSAGIGVGISTNWGEPGLMFSNDVKISVTEKLWVNPRISFFQTAFRYGDDKPGKAYRSESTVFWDLGIAYTIVNKPTFSFSILSGLSYATGHTTAKTNYMLFGRDYVDGSDHYDNGYFSDLGGYLDLELDWDKGARFIHKLFIRSGFYYTIEEPQYMSIGYKAGFRL